MYFMTYKDWLRDVKELPKEVRKKIPEADGNRDVEYQRYLSEYFADLDEKEGN